MGYRDYLPSEDAQYLAWLTNFANQCDAYSPTLALTPAQLAQIEGFKTQFEVAFNEMNFAKASAKAAVQRKDSVRQSTQSSVRQWARTFKGNPAVTPQILAALGIVASASATPVVPVTELTVVGCSDGVNQLRWNRSTNVQGTIFIVEYRTDTDTDWELAGVVTATRFDHPDQMPGVETWYRVISNRAGRSSAACPPVAVYGQAGNGESLAVAA